MTGGGGQELYRRALELIPGGTQLLSKRPELFLPEQWPAYFSRAEGPYVWDLDGKRYLDMSHCSVGACVLGYADPDVNAAVKRAVDAGNISTLNCPEEVELAELLCELHPWAERVRFARTGGESMAVAVRIARAYTGRSKVAFCGYHGWHDWYLAVNLYEPDALGKKGLLLPGLDPAGVPAELHGTAFAFRHNHIEELEPILQEHAGDLAAIIAEPQRHERPAPGFLEGLRTAADRGGSVLIFDEISSGFRLNCGGVHLLYGVEPDIAVFSKAMGNGFPIGAVIGRREVMEAAQKTFISSTYWSERIGPTAALATIRKYRRVRAEERLIAAGERVLNLWRDGIRRYGLQAEVEHDDMPPLPHLRYLYPNARAVQTLHCQLMLERGVLDNCAFYATYAHDDGVIDRYASVLEEVLDELKDAIESGAVEQRLRGPLGQSGFARLTR